MSEPNQLKEHRRLLNDRWLHATRLHVTSQDGDLNYDDGVDGAHPITVIQKKPKHGIATPRAELDLIDWRLKRAREDYEQWAGSEKPKSR